MLQPARPRSRLCGGQGGVHRRASEMGPDLNRPMSPTEYFEPSALRRYPGALRNWPQRMMQGFAPDQLSNYEINAIHGPLALPLPRQAPRTPLLNRCRQSGCHSQRRSCVITVS
jgi:hypothetical protein